MELVKGASKLVEKGPDDIGEDVEGVRLDRLEAVVLQHQRDRLRQGKAGRLRVKLEGAIVDDGLGDGGLLDAAVADRCCWMQGATQQGMDIDQVGVKLCRQIGLRGEG